MIFPIFVDLQQQYDFIEKGNEDVGVTDGLKTNIVDDIVKKSDDDIDFQHPYEDNRFVDNMNEHFVNSTMADVNVAQAHDHFYDDEPELRNKIDFAEKKEYRKLFSGTLWLHCTQTKL